MNEKQLLRAQLASVRKELAEVFPRLTDSLIDWAPGPGVRTIHGQFVEIMSTEENIADLLAGGLRRSEQDVEGPLWACKTISGLVKKLDEVRARTLHILDSVDDAKLSAAVPVSPGFGQWLELNPVPMSELVRFIARHESYHAGQLVTYLWSRGDDPYKWGD